MKKTPTYHLPYVEPADKQADFPTHNKASADAIDAALKNANVNAFSAATAAKSALKTATAASQEAASATTTAAAAKTTAEGIAATAAEAKKIAEAARSHVTTTPRILYGISTVSISSGSSNSVGHTVPLNPQFTKAPAVQVSINHAPSGSARLTARAYSVTSTSFSIALYTGDGSTVTEDVTLPIAWTAIGPA